MALRHLLLFLFTCSTHVIAYAQSKMTVPQLKQRILDTLEQQKGVFALAFKDLSTGKILFINEHELFHAASTMKTPVLIELYKQSTAKKFSLSDSILVTNKFKSIVDSSTYTLDSDDDGETDLYRHIGEKQPISNLAYRMIKLISNLSTNLLIALVDAKNVTQTMREMGAKDIQVLRGVEDNKAFDKGMNNMVTAFDLMTIFESLANGKAVSDGASQAMIRILLDQKFNEVIPGKLPPGIKVAHKTGSFKTVHHDSGIIFLPDGRKYVLVILSKNLEDDDAAVKMMASVSRLIYDWENQH